MTNPHTSTNRPGHQGDPIASLTLALVAVAALITSWFLPWWVMEARAPQYGQRTLVVSVSPVRVGGDVFEVDTLGHYVGIKPMTSLAKFERTIAPYGLVAAILGMLAAPWLSRRWLRLAALLPAILLPLLFLVDLSYWMNKSVSERDLDAALNLTVTQVDPRLLGKYELGQFKVSAKVESGLLLTGVAALLGVGLLFARPIGSHRVGQDGPALRALALSFLAIGLASAARSAEHRVAPGQSLAGAIAAASPGDTIVVAPGIHAANLKIDRTLRILGEPGAILDGRGVGTVVSLHAPSIELRGLKIRGSGDNLLREDAGVRVDRAPHARLVDLTIEDSLFGVFVLQSEGTVIERSTIVGKDLEPDRRGDGIRVWYSNGCQILSNHVERSRDVILWYSNHTRAEDNTVRNSRYGLHYMYADHNSFRRNRFEDNQVGATVMYSRDVELSDNSFSYSNGVAAYGLLLKESNDIVATANRFVGNATAIFLDDAPQNRGARLVLHRNLVARNQVGIALLPRTHGAEVWENAFIGNRVQVEVIGGGTAENNAWSVGGRGNYWSDAVVYDRDRDGVSEIPYRAESTFEAMTGRHPALQWFGSSPAADAIDSSARLFPIFAPRPRMTDSHPLMAPVIDDTMRAGSGPARGGGLAVTGAALLAAVFVGALAAIKVLS